MLKKFRNSLLGFNKDDVMSFVMESKETESILKKKIAEQSAEIGALGSELAELKSLQAETAEKLSQAEDELTAYRQREEVLTQLSESIGRLYLVAKANAESVIKNANESAEISLRAVDKNIEVAALTENELQEIGEMLNEKTREYLTAVEGIKKQLSETKKNAEESKASIALRQAEMAEITTK